MLKAILVKDFKTQKYSVIKRLRAKFINLYEEMTSFWKYIQSGYHQFLRHETNATLIENLSVADLLDFYHQYIISVPKEYCGILSKRFCRNLTNRRCVIFNSLKLYSSHSRAIILVKLLLSHS